jgi:hypothetical protein
MAGSYWSADLAPALGDVLIGPARGVLVYQPWLLVSLAALLPSVRRVTASLATGPCPSGWPFFCLAVIGLHVALVASWRYWWGGHCWGSRLFAEAIPLAALLCVRPLAALGQGAVGKCLLAPLVLLSFWMHGSSTFGRADYWNNWADINHHPERLRSWSRPPFLYPFQHYKPF